MRLGLHVETHHGQSLQMTALAPQRAGSDRVRRLAERVAASRTPETGAVQGRLEAHRAAGDTAHPTTERFRAWPPRSNWPGCGSHGAPHPTRRPS
ncbi:DUF305 domain-containing protein [Streptomyces sp. NPDC059169]|uniref:DUF305 domain-containing protein n=1 Tax=Streptomyces sp. NPDC059169 TaxID=3346754 RepID=UPI00369609C0